MAAAWGEEARQARRGLMAAEEAMVDGEFGGDPPCWEHLLDEEGRLGQREERPWICVRRVYDPPLADDGFRVLVDRLWPRGVRKQDGALDAWPRDLAPSDALRTWYGHAPERWPEFEQRYRDELAGSRQQALLAEVAQRARRGRVTLLCAARDPSRSNAEVVRSVLEEMLQQE